MGHLDERAGQNIDDGGAGLAHHVRHDDHGEGQARQHDGIHFFPQRHLIVYVGYAREDDQLHRQQGDQDVGNAKFRKRDRAEGRHRNETVKKAVAVQRGQDPQQDGNRDRHHCGGGGQKQGVGKPPPDQIDDGTAVCP